MYYVLLVILGIIVYSIVFRVVKSFVKGCLTTVFFLMFVIVAWMFFKSTKFPVSVFNTYTIDNLKIERIEK